MLSIQIWNLIEQHFQIKINDLDMKARDKWEMFIALIAKEEEVEEIWVKIKGLEENMEGMEDIIQDVERNLDKAYEAIDKGRDDLEEFLTSFENIKSELADLRE